MNHLHQIIQQNVAEWRAAGYPCDDYPAIAEILDYARLPDGETLRFLRRPQLRALETYWYLRLVENTPLFRAKIPDWRAMVDVVMIDTTYAGEVFDIALSDVPERKDDLVRGHYELDAPEGPATVTIKIIDMLGEEVLVVEEV